MDLLESYKKAKCKCIIKGNGETSLVNRKNTRLHFRSIKNSLKAPLANFLCGDQTKIDMVLYTSLLIKVNYPIKQLILHYFIYTQIFH